MNLILHTLEQYDLICDIMTMLNLHIRIAIVVVIFLIIISLMSNFILKVYAYCKTFIKNTKKKIIKQK